MTDRINIHDVLARHSFDHAVICTYMFDTSFFEEYCLDKFNSLSGNGNISVLLDRGTYEQIAAGPETARPRQANLRYLLHPISVPGVFHPKLFLFATASKGLLVVGSANFTRQGLTANAELAASFTFEAGKREDCAPLFRQAFAFVRALADRWGGEALRSNLNEMAADARWLNTTSSGDEDFPVRLIHNLDEVLWDQICSGLKPPVEAVHVLSRFFDPTPQALMHVTRNLQPRRTTLYTENGTTTLTKEWVRYAAASKGRAVINLCAYRDGERHQTLHAKALAIVHSGSCRFAAGSANFTTPALLSPAPRGNVEVMLLYQDSRQVRPEKLFDPDATAVELTDEDNLKTGPDDKPVRPTEPRDIDLHEVVVDGRRLQCALSFRRDVAFDRLVAQLEFPDHTKTAVKLTRITASLFTGDLAQPDLARIDANSSLVWVEAHEHQNLVASSNRIFVTNLQDIKTGHNLRRERHVREAQESAVQFASVLQALIRGGDDAALMAFLSYCDIPVVNAARPPFLRGGRPQWDDSEGMRSLGPRNLEIFRSLHQAAMAFVERHQRRLQRHVTHGTIDGVGNYLHIAVAICGVARSQVERMVVGLESRTAPLTVDDWYQCRSDLELYLGVLLDVLKHLAEEYVPALIQRHGSEDVGKALEAEIGPLKDLFRNVLALRERLEASRSSSLKLDSPYTGITTPTYGERDLLEETRWRGYRAAIDREFGEILSRTTSIRRR